MLIHHRIQVQEIEERRALGEIAAGSLWRGLKTNAAGVLASMQWINEQMELLGSPHVLKRQLDQWPEDADPDDLAHQLENGVDMAEERWNDIMRICNLDMQQAFSEDSIRCVPLTAVMSRMSHWEKDPDGQEDWIQLYDAANTVSERGLKEIRERLADGRLSCKHACGTYDYIRAEAIYDRFLALNPNLGKINGRDRSALVEKFRKLDADILHLSAQEVMSAHYEGIPKGTRGEMGLLRNQTKLKRHKPLRWLLKEAGDAVQAVKPVFLMSPLSVAQYLDPDDGPKFDLLLIDEASQVRPADAFGAIMRSKHAIIVGDEKQLPPSPFFNKLVINEEESDNVIEPPPIKGMESILTLCEARTMYEKTLKWHYRSEHESLIAVSNREFYKNDLVCPPSPIPLGESLGLDLEFVGGVYRRGKGKSNNPDEARAVMNAVLEHARKTPHESLGVVAMSVAQQDTILNEAERLRAKHPELNDFCDENKQNPFFVKNLETVQGDERDVIFISIGYGKDKKGKFFQNFGPVSNEGGERRLNVLFTRAKKRCRVFASVLYDEIKADEAKHEGPEVLRKFLQYAATGKMDVPEYIEREPETLFEEAVGNAIREYGHEVDYRVGSEGFLIDIAVKDPDRKGGYLLAIECDGVRYHSSEWARERDRMRQSILESKGWSIHRVWSTDWFNNPRGEARKVDEAIRMARERKKSQPAVDPSPANVIKREEPESEPPLESPDFYVEFRKGQGSKYSRGTQRAIQDAPERKVAALITEIVTVEGPVHEDIVIEKTKIVWRYKQMGDQISKTIREAIQLALREGMIERCTLNRSFLKHSSNEIRIRNRSKLKGSPLRKPDMISPEEYRSAIVDAVKRCISMSDEHCAVDCARMFGFQQAIPAFKKQVKTQIESLLEEGKLARKPKPNEWLRIGDSIA